MERNRRPIMEGDKMKIVFGHYYKVKPKQFVIIGIGFFHNYSVLELLNCYVEFQKETKQICTNDALTCNQPYACDACPYNTEDLELGGRDE